MSAEEMKDLEADLRLLILLEFLFLGITFVMLALDVIIGAIFGLVLVIILWSLAQATFKDGIQRRFWQRISGSLNGIPLETKRDALDEYTVTDETDLEELEP